MTIYTADDFALAARRIEAFTERGDPGGIGRKHLRAAVAALRLCEGRIRAVEASWPDEAALRRWHRREHEGCELMRPAERPWFDRAEEYARLVSARYYEHREPFGRADMDAAITASMRAYAEERLREERLRARYGDSPELIAFGLTGRREFTAPWAQAIVRAAVTGEPVDAG